MPTPRPTGRADDQSEPSAASRAAVTDAQLAVLCRQVQWALDDAAHDSPAGRLTAEKRELLAGMLESLAIAIRDSGGVVIDTEPG